MEWVFDDGGRAKAGFKGTTGDCVCRAIAIATKLPYKEVYNLINEFAKSERRGKRKKGISSARTGVYKQTIRKVMEYLGWEWVPTMKIGQGCKVHLNADELPSGRLVVALANHEVAVIDGVIHDTYNSSDRGYTVDGNGNDITVDRCVYGYYRRKVDGMGNEFGVGDVVKIRDEEILGKIVMPILDEDGTWWYEVEAVGLDHVPTREIRESDLKLA